MRIAQVVATFPPYRGGTGNVTYHNARDLARRGHDVHVFTMARSGASQCEVLDGMTVHRLRPLVQLGNAAALPGLTRALRGFDIIHLHYPFFGGEFATLAAKLWRTPLVVTYQHDVFLGGAMGVVAYLMRQTVMRLTLRSAARVLFSSLDYGRASHIRPLLRGRADRVGELPNGVDTSVFIPGEPPVALRARLRPGDDDRLVLLVAGLDRAHYFKGVEVLLTALAALPGNVRGAIVGDGDLRPGYEATTRRLGLADRVVFAGRVSDEELPDYYRLADVTVLPSVTMGEAFGLVLVESLACATPVIATDLPGVRTVVDHGVNGLLVAPGDAIALSGAIERITGDIAGCERWGEAGRAKTRRCYAWEAIGDQLETMYSQAIADNPSIRRGRGRALGAMRPSVDGHAAERRGN
jgi:glycosyltransferase involved in cell wall biosynthesis